MADPDSRNASERPGSYSSYGLPTGASIAITSVVTGQFTIVESAGYQTVGRLGGAATTIVIGSVDIVDAYRHGTTNDVVVHSFGLGGAVFGGLIAGAGAGGAAGFFMGPIGSGVIGFIGGVAGAFYGEDWVQSKVNSWLTQRITGPYEDPRSMSEIEGWGVEDPLCFPALTPIAISLTETRPISDIRVGDTVLAFDPAADLGRGALVPRKVVRLYRNSTDEWVKLTWAEGGEAKELIATPGHHFLERFSRTRRGFRGDHDPAAAAENVCFVPFLPIVAQFCCIPAERRL